MRDQASSADLRSDSQDSGLLPLGWVKGSNTVFRLSESDLGPRAGIPGYALLTRQGHFESPQGVLRDAFCGHTTEQLSSDAQQFYNVFDSGQQAETFTVLNQKRPSLHSGTRNSVVLKWVAGGLAEKVNNLRQLRCNLG
ncbi:hypothetical protein WJX79_009802 [Trebouxia sp. C0005]